MQEVIFEVKPLGDQRIGLITLHRQAALHTLTQAMCEQIFQKLCLWEQDREIAAVMIQGVGERAFCAGGDIRALYHAGKENWQRAQQFFWQEYRLNYKIKTLKKPYIALLNGLCMGGGVGISLYAQFKIAKKHLLWAMPETAIGLFPDVGVSHFFSRIDPALARFVLLTGIHLDAAAARYLGVIDAVIDADFAEIFKLIAAEKNLTVIEVVRRAADKFCFRQSSNLILENETLIKHCFAPDRIAEIFHRLENSELGFAKKLLAMLHTRAPISLQITLERLKRAKDLSFAETLQMDYRVASRFLQCPDLYEGIRAAIIDKDKKPRWTLGFAEIDAALIEQFFAPLEETPELVLPE